MDDEWEIIFFSPLALHFPDIFLYRDLLFPILCQVVIVETTFTDSDDTCSMLDDHRLEGLEISFYNLSTEVLSVLRVTSDRRIENSWISPSKTQSFL
jgi:hypothetical protein